MAKLIQRMNLEESMRVIMKCITALPAGVQKPRVMGGDITPNNFAVSPPIV